jgi:type II secretory pathway component PulF
MRKLGAVICVVSLLGLAAMAYLAFVVPRWIEEARETEKALSALEVSIYNLSQCATGYGLFVAPILLGGVIVGAFLIAKGGGKKKA